MKKFRNPLEKKIMGQFLMMNLYYGSYTCISEHILVLRILYLYYGTYSCISDLILIL